MHTDPAVDKSQPSLAVRELQSWLDASPTPFHCVDTAVGVLDAAGFVEANSYIDLPSKGYMRADGSLHAWHLPAGAPRGIRLVAAHTDSPNLRLRPQPDLRVQQWNLLGVEIYGGVLLNSWLDRDLGVAGRVVLDDGSSRLFRSPSPVARIPQLAIHLDREIGERGLILDRHQHLRPVWSTGGAPGFREWLAALLAVEVGRILAHESHLFDHQESRRIGDDLLASARLDNQVSCWAATTALTDTVATSSVSAMVALYDHEEVGSASTTGAAAPATARLLRALYSGLDEPAYFDAMRESICLSIDNAHGIHPNYPERHDGEHAPHLNAGPALKINNNQRYATGARGEGLIRSVAASAGIPLQTFVSRNNIPCGSTIGPIAATALGIETIDVGIPQLSMHSAREVCGVEDPHHLRSLAAAFMRHG